MSITPRAIAVEGFGYTSKYIAKLGFETTIEIVVRPVATGGDSSGGPLKPTYEIIITISRKGRIWSRRYILYRYINVRVFVKILTVIVNKLSIFARHKNSINNKIKVIAEVKHEHFKD